RPSSWACSLAPCWAPRARCCTSKRSMSRPAVKNARNIPLSGHSFATATGSWSGKPGVGRRRYYQSDGDEPTAVTPARGLDAKRLKATENFLRMGVDSPPRDGNNARHLGYIAQLVRAQHS